MDWDLLDATNHYEWNGWDFVGMSDSWKTMCLDMPCSKRVQVPLLYKQQFLHTKIDGHDVVIQAWKGNCPQTYREMPGGIGGEVGVYRVIHGREIPNELSLPRLDKFPAPIRPVVKIIVSRILKELLETAEHGVDWWWPFPELNAPIEMKLLHPEGGVLFDANPHEPAGGYWMSRWMSYRSYQKYVIHEALHGRTAPNPYDYHMELAVKGKRFRWDAPSSPIKPI